MLNQCPCGSFVPADSNWNFTAREESPRRCRPAAARVVEAKPAHPACPIPQERCSADTACAKNHKVGMISAEVQQIEKLYELDAALKAGTLYPELHKPMSGYCPSGQPCGDDEQALAFTLWELRLYLNTHPCDKEALALFGQLRAKACGESYATAFLDDCLNSWSWTDSPWPWEYAANCCNHSRVE